MTTQPVSTHTNEFMILNGKPFVVGEYLDDKPFIQLDRSIVKNEIIVDQSEAYRAIIDVSIDAIGKRSSDGLPNIIGNQTKMDDLISIIRENFRNLDHQLPLLKSGIVIRVNYQLENNRTGQVIRTMCEDLRIADRNYFVDLNHTDINDNAVVVNFASTMVSTINQFTHGTDPMILRLTKIQLCYECVKPDPATPRISYQYQDPNLPHYIPYSPNSFEARAAEWEYHLNAQPHQNMGDGRCNPYPNVPESWVMYNRYYHFDNGGKDVILHQQEIDSPHTKTVLYDCGQVQVNRAFLVNPGHRIIFKFSIWKNDIVMVNDSTPIARALNVWPIPPCPPPVTPPEPPKPVTPPCQRPPYYPYYPYPGYDLLLKILEMDKRVDTKQDEEIKELARAIKDLEKIIKHKPKPHPPVPPVPHPHHPPKSLKLIIDMIKGLQKKVDELIEKGNIEMVPISDEEIQEIIDAIEADWLDDGDYNGSVDYPVEDEPTEPGEGEDPTDPEDPDPVDPEDPTDPDDEIIPGDEDPIIIPDEPTDPDPVEVDPDLITDEQP